MSMQPGLATWLAGEQLTVRPGTHRVGLVSLGRKLIALKRWPQELTSGERSVALSGRYSLDPHESKCACEDAHSIHPIEKH